MQCESKPGRGNLSFRLCDWFRKFGWIYDIDDKGIPRYRKYGSHYQWELVSQVDEKVMPSMSSIAINSSDQISDSLANQLLLGDSDDDLSMGSLDPKDSLPMDPQMLLPRLAFIRDFEIPETVSADLRTKIVDDTFYEGKVYGDLKEGFGFPHRFHDAWYLSATVDIEDGSKIQCIDDGNEYCTVGTKDILTLSEEYDPLFDGFREIGFNMGMLTIRKSSTIGNQISCFKPHRDKLEGSVVFVTLTEYFWVVVAVPCQDGGDDTEQFMKWRQKLNKDEARCVDKILNDDCFKNRFRSIYKCEPGCALAFDAKEIYHATITPKSFGHRVVCIFTAVNEIVGSIADKSAPASRVSVTAKPSRTSSRRKRNKR